MPYITQEARGQLLSGDRMSETAGELNYMFSILAGTYWAEHPNYQGINDIVGALEGAKAEFQRRIVAPYEDIKIVVNGDVYATQG